MNISARLCSVSVNELFDCENGGTCYTNGEDGTSWCSCPEGFGGYDCGVSKSAVPLPDNVIECPTLVSVLRHCANGGRCYMQSLKRSLPLEVKCMCPQYFSGDHCFTIEDVGPHALLQKPVYRYALPALIGGLISIVIFILAVLLRKWKSSSPSAKKKGAPSGFVNYDPTISPMVDQNQ